MRSQNLWKKNLKCHRAELAPLAPPTALPKNLPLLLPLLILCFLTLLRLQVLEVVDKFASAATGAIPVVTGDVVAAVDVEDEEDAGAETTGA